MNLKNYKVSSVFSLFVILISVITIILYSFNNWLNSYTNQLINDNVKLIIFVLSTVLSPTLIIAVFNLIDTKLWKYNITNFLIDIPNINGWYYGTNHSNIRAVDNKVVDKLCSMEIVQTASTLKINLYLYNEESNTYSVCENISSILEIDDVQSKIYYTYRNEKDPKHSHFSPHISIGTAVFRLIYGNNQPIEIHGSYFNQRGNTGEIKVVFVNNSIERKFRKPSN